MLRCIGTFDWMKLSHQSSLEIWSRTSKNFPLLSCLIYLDVYFGSGRNEEEARANTLRTLEILSKCGFIVELCSKLLKFSSPRRSFPGLLMKFLPFYPQGKFRSELLLEFLVFCRVLDELWEILSGCAPYTCTCGWMINWPMLLLCFVRRSQRRATVLGF